MKKFLFTNANFKSCVTLFSWLVHDCFWKNFPTRAKQMPSKVLFVGKKKRRPYCNDNSDRKVFSLSFTVIYSWEIKRLHTDKTYVYYVFYLRVRLYKHQVNTDSISWAPLYCLYLEWIVPLWRFSYPLASFVWYTIKYQKFISTYLSRGFNVDLQSAAKSSKS